MKRLVILLIMLSPFLGFSQNTQKIYPSTAQGFVNNGISESSIFNFYYGTSEVFGFSFMMGKRTVWSGDFSTYVGRSGIGKNYTDALGPMSQGADIYETLIAPQLSGGIIIGRRIGRITPHFRSGVGVKRKYFNGYDQNKIMAPDGYWYISQHHKSLPYFGGGIVYLSDLFNVYLGWDTFNGSLIGIGLRI